MPLAQFAPDRLLHTSGFGRGEHSLDLEDPVAVELGPLFGSQHPHMLTRG